MEPRCDGHILDTDIGGAEYWRGKAKEWKEEWQEFQQETRDLELELEAQLEEAEKQIKQLETINKGLFIYYVILFQAFLDPHPPLCRSVSAFGLPPPHPPYGVINGLNFIPS